MEGVGRGEDTDNARDGGATPVFATPHDLGRGGIRVLGGVKEVAGGAKGCADRGGGLRQKMDVRGDAKDVVKHEEDKEGLQLGAGETCQGAGDDFSDFAL